MSYITDVVVFVGYAPPDIEAALIESQEGQRGSALRRIDFAAAGGSKVFTSRVYGAAFNYFDPEAFGAWIAALAWPDFARREVIVIIATEQSLPVAHGLGALDLVELELAEAIG